MEPSKTYLPKVILAPGRVNMLGEHIDYNDGIVLPAAIDRYVRLEFFPVDEPIITLNALDLNKNIRFSVTSLDDHKDIEGNPLPGFALYPAGVAWALKKAGFIINGVEAFYSSTIPIGSGLSSSAAVQVAFATAWNYLGGWNIPSMELAKICQISENQYIGVNSGLMDQFACLLGLEDHVLAFDTRSLDWKPIPLPKDTAIVIADSHVPRSLSGSAYNNRRSECEQALTILKSHLPNMTALRDVSPQQFFQLKHYLPDVIRKRAQYIIEECDRVQKSLDHLMRSDAIRFGKLMSDCHNGLRDLYEVSCPELDILVEIAGSLEGCFGARLTGAGFGGCTVNLVEETFVDSFINQLTYQYKDKTGKESSVYLCHAANGALLIRD